MDPCHFYDVLPLWDHMVLSHMMCPQQKHMVYKKVPCVVALAWT